MTNPVLSVQTEFGRYYVHPTRRSQVPSITNIKGKKAIDALKFWAARQAAEYAADNLLKLNALEHDEVVQLVRSAPFARKGDSASAIGDIVHNWIDRYIKGETVSPEELRAAPLQARGMWRQFGGFVKRYNPDWIDSEFTVWSDTHGYAGTADWAARIGPFLTLADTKTGNRVYADVGIQLAALAKADCILQPSGHEIAMPKFERFAVLHLRPTFAKLIPVEHIDECFKAFLALKGVFDFDREVAEQVLMFAPKIETRAA